MHLTASGLGKRFSGSWVFRQINCTIEQGTRAAIVGRNGSGKSTLLQILSGMMPPSEGQVTRWLQGTPVEEEQCYRFLSFTAPYQLLPEQFTAMEVVTLWGKTKAFRDRIPSKELLERAGLGQANHKLIAKFSSGMKTRLKLALALYCDVPLIVLDEPTSNLDAQGVDWYLQSIEQVPTSTTVLVASNVPAEYAFCSQTVVMHG